MRLERVKIGEIAKVKGGKRLPHGYDVQDEPTDHPYLRVVDFDDNGLNPAHVKFISNEVHEKIRRYTITDKDIYVSIAGTIGRVGIVPALFSGANLTENAAQITDISESVDAPYLYYFLKGHTGQELLKSKAGGTSQPKLALYRLAEIEFPKPSFQAQRRIARVLSAYDDLIENNCRRIELLEQAARLLYREWFVHFRFPGHEHVKVTDGIPLGSEQVCVADKFDTTAGGTPSRQYPEFFSGNINWVKTQELNERPIFETSEKITEEAVARSSAKILPGQTLLVSIYGNTNIGRTGLLALPGSSNQACVALLPKRRKEDWIYAQLWLQQHREQIVGLAQGSAQTNISQETLRGLKMIWPTGLLLDAFLDSVLSSYHQIECLCLQNSKLAQARNLLLPRLMNGEIAV